MKIAILPFLLILLLYACTENGETQQAPLEEEVQVVDNTVEDQAQSLASPKEEIESFVEQINKDIRAKRHELTQTTWELDTIRTIEVKEYRSKNSSQRMKLVYEATFLADSHPLLQTEDRLIQLMKTYYYENNDIRFVDEIVDYAKDSLTKGRMKNRFYIEEGKLIHWEKDGEEMDQTHAMYSYFQSVLIDQNYFDVCYAYDLASDLFGSNESILARSRSKLIETYREVLHWKYPESDTIQVIYEGNLMQNVALLEVLPDSASNDPSMLLRLHLKENANDRYWEGEESLIGRAYHHRAQIKTPGDFYYTLMKIVEREEIDKLRMMVPEQGVYSQATAIVGDIDKPKYDEITSTKDSIKIADVRAWFQADVFRFDVHIDEAFDDQGLGTITWYGGGFMEEIKAQKNGEKLYLMEHRSMDH